jgi:nicotinamide riboside kinase
MSQIQNSARVLPSYNKRKTGQENLYKMLESNQQQFINREEAEYDTSQV